MTADIDLESGTESGPIYIQGGALGGMGLYLKDGVPTFLFRSFDGKQTAVTASQPLHAGLNHLSLDLDRQVAPMLTMQDVTITIGDDGDELAKKTVQFAMPYMFTLSETFDLGHDWGNQLSTDYPAGEPFPGKISNVVFDFNR